MSHALAITVPTSQLSSDWNPWMTVRCRKLHLTRGNSSKAVWNCPRNYKSRWHLLSFAHRKAQKPAAILQHGYAGKGHGLACVWGSFLAWNIKCTESPSHVLTALGEVWNSLMIWIIHLPKQVFEIFEIPLIYVRDPMTHELQEKCTFLQGNVEIMMSWNISASSTCPWVGKFIQSHKPILPHS